MAQARQLIDLYQAEIAPKAPEPAPIPRFSFGSLPERVAAKAVAEPSKPVRQSPAADLGTPPVGKPVRILPEAHAPDQVRPAPRGCGEDPAVKNP